MDDLQNLPPDNGETLPYDNQEPIPESQQNASDQQTTETEAEGGTADNVADKGDAIQRLRSVYTTNLPSLLKRLGISLLVTTYQAGKMVIVRADGDSINTHFCGYKKPMGMAANRSHLAVGTQTSIQILRNMPDVARKLDPPGTYDACYIPRMTHVTGDIDIHEMAWSGNDLWFINTRFSCLCSFDADHSFTPRWRPSFVSAYTPEDRCHLNGLGMVNGKPKYVTALGETDGNESWRQNKAHGGILMDVTTGKVLLRGISMPHSPRWYDKRLWLLESGNGSLTIVDLAESRLHTVAELPGYTRGIDFFGRLAFIGLSQVRDSVLFSGIPLVERLQDERFSGVWVVNIDTGQTVAFLRFEEAVQEIFSVQVLPGLRFPHVLDIGDERVSNSYVLPDDALADVPETLRGGAPRAAPTAPTENRHPDHAAGRFVPCGPEQPLRERSEQNEAKVLSRCIFSLRRKRLS